MDNILEKRPLKYHFSAKETHELSLQLARKNREITTISDEKKSVTSQYKARMDEVQAAINKLACQVNDGFEMRDTECRVEYHRPKKGFKMYIRTDTNTVVDAVKMSAEEWNLFTQWEEGSTEDDGSPLLLPYNE